jgi:hypothetical protein
MSVIFNFRASVHLLDCSCAHLGYCSALAERTAIWSARAQDPHRVFYFPYQVHYDACFKFGARRRSEKRLRLYPGRPPSGLNFGPRGQNGGRKWQVIRNSSPHYPVLGSQPPTAPMRLHRAQAAQSQIGELQDVVSVPAAGHDRVWADRIRASIQGSKPPFLTAFSERSNPERLYLETARAACPLSSTREETRTQLDFGFSPPWIAVRPARGPSSPGLLTEARIHRRPGPRCVHDHPALVGGNVVTRY